MASRPLATLLAFALALDLVGAPGVARADVAASPPAPPAAPCCAEVSEVKDGLRAYYASEKTTAYIFVGVGAASAAAGASLLAVPRDLTRGLGASLLAFGVLEAAGAAFYAFQVDAEIDRYGATLARDPAAFKRDELAHIQGTTSRTTLYRASELALVAGGAGVAAYGFSKGQDTWKGVGIGVAAEALTFFVLDSFGAARARAYEGEIQRFAPKVSLQLGASGQPAGVALGGLF